MHFSGKAILIKNNLYSILFETFLKFLSKSKFFSLREGLTLFQFCNDFAVNGNKQNNTKVVSFS